MDGWIDGYARRATSRFQAKSYDGSVGLLKNRRIVGCWVLSFSSNVFPGKAMDLNYIVLPRDNGYESVGKKQTLATSEVR